ncbi:MAG: hypothetical protein ACI9QL_002467 [Candidatus Omnitrophota bacterium]|jgi:hypothetical protein
MLRVILLVLYTLTPAFAQVVINEIHYDAEPNNLRNEFVELHNTGPVEVDLANWYFTGIDFVFPSGTALGAGEFIVVAADTNALNAVTLPTGNFVDLADLVGGGDGSLPGTGSASGINAVDGAVGQGGGGGNYTPASPTGYYAVSYPTIDGVFLPNGTVGAQPLSSTGLTFDFAAYADTSPSYGMFYNGVGSISNPSSQGGLTEAWDSTPNTHSLLTAHAPKGITFDLDAIESLYSGRQTTNFTCVAGDSRSNGGGSIDLLVLVDGVIKVSHVFIVNTEFAIAVALAPGDRFLTLVSANSANGNNSDHGYFGNPFVHLEPGVPIEPPEPPPLLGPFSGQLSNEGERITLHNALGEIIDEVDYGTAFPWPAGALGEGLSMELIDPALDNDLAGSWRSGSELTPGKTNSVYSTVHPPHIRQVDHSPNAPTSSEAVTVTAKVTDPDGVAAVRLFYQVVAPGNYIPAFLAKSSSELLSNPNGPWLPNPVYENPANWIELPMIDDGSGEDRYTVTLPAQAHRTLVRYRIEVEDAGGQSVRVPYADDPNLNFACFAYNGVPDYTVETRTVQPGGPPYTYPASVMTSIPVYTLICDLSDFDQCVGYNGADHIPSNNFDARSAYNWTGTFVYDGKVYDNMKYRLRQRNARYSGNAKRSFRFRFNKGNYIQLVDLNGEPYPEKWRTMNSQKCRGSRGNYNFGLVDTSSAELFNAFGVPAPEAHMYHWRVIKGADEAPAGVDGQHNGDFFGYYQAMEDYDVRFIDGHKLPKGNLYKLKTAQLEGENVRRYLEPHAVADGSDYENIIFNMRPAQTDAWVNDHVDFENWSRYHAVIEGIRSFDVAPNTGEHLKNRAFYFEPTDGLPLGRLRTLPWDTDTSWGPNWNSGEDWVKNATLSNGGRPEFWKRYRNEIREFRDLVWQPNQIDPLLDNLAARLEPFVAADRDRWRSAPSHSEDTGDIAPKVVDMKKFAWDGGTWVGDFAAVERPSGTDDHLDGLATDPEIPDAPVISYTGPVGYPVNEIQFQSTAYSDPQGAGTFAAVAWRIGRAWNPADALHDPNAIMVFEAEAIWESGSITQQVSSIAIPSDALQTGLTYRARVRYLDDTGRWSHWSAPNEFSASEPSNLVALQDHLRISELMYNAPEGSAFDYIEFHNTSSTLDLALDGVSLVGGIGYTFPPGTVLPAGAYLIVANTDPGTFAGVYGAVPSVVLGPYDRNLSNSGDNLQVLPPGGGAPVIAFNYDDRWGWPLAADGVGHSLIPLLQSDQQDGRLDHPIHWAASVNIKGSPGQSEPPPSQHMVINEFAAHTDFSDPGFPGFDSNDWIELFNPNPLPVNLSGYYLSDDPADPTKWALPGGALAPGSHLSFDEITGFHQVLTNGFGLNKAGEAIYLSYLPGGTNRTVDAVRFKAQENGRSFGRFPDGSPWWYAMPPTRDAANERDGSPELVIRELMFAPEGSNTLEYVELFNPRSTPVELWNETGVWRMAGGVDYTFPAATTVSGLSYIVLVNFAPTNSALRGAFLSSYALTNPAPLFGPYGGSLSGLGERVAIEKPMAPDAPGDPVGWVVVDELLYYRDFPWPSDAVENGRSIHRVTLEQSGHDPANWLSAAGSPGVRFDPPALTANPATMNLEWMGASGAVYIVEASDTLEDGTWIAIGQVNAAGMIQYADPGVPTSGRRYYRLRLIP